MLTHNFLVCASFLSTSLAVPAPDLGEALVNPSLERRQGLFGSLLPSTPLIDILAGPPSLGALVNTPVSNILAAIDPLTGVAATKTPIASVDLCVYAGGNTCVVVGASQRARARREADCAGVSCDLANPPSTTPTRRQILLEASITVCPLGEKACPSGLTGYECVGEFETCHE